jgi:predicted acylesterase/phospholipase RssA
MITAMPLTRPVRWVVALSLLLGGCFAQVRDLPPLAAKPTFAPIPESSPDFLVGLALSGGGSRAATFAAAVLEELARIPVKDAGGQRSVLEKVQYISSVSGGSLAAGYFAARKPPRSEPMLGSQGLSPVYRQFFKDYQAAMQENYERAAIWRQLLLFRAFNPTKAAYSVAEVWDARFLHGMTFNALYERERAGDSPRIIFNGTSYNSGQRFALTTLPAADFDYDFVSTLLENLVPRSGGGLTEGQRIIEANLRQARSQFLPLTFEQLGADHRDLPISLAMVSSASFPPAVGPVTYGIAGGQPRYEHVGDGGLFDNLGTESLATFFLKKIPRGSSKRGLIIVIDAAFPFDANQAFLDGNQRGFEVFKNDPSRIVGIMEERANAYQLMLWDALRTQGILLPDFANLRVEVLRHTEPDWGVFKDLPEACRGHFSEDVTTKAIKEAVSQIPTRFQVSSCNAALMIQAAQKVVALHRQRIVDFLERTP